MNRHRLITLGIPALVLIATVVWSLSIRHELPDPVASHFTLAGEVDGTMPPLVLILGLAGMGAVLLLLFSQLNTSRTMAGVGAGTTILLAVLQVLLLAPQRGLTDATEASPGPAVPLALGTAIIAGLLIAALADPPATPTATETTDSVTLHPGARAAWFSSARASGLSFWLMVSTPVPLALGAIALFLDGDWAVAALLAVALPAVLMFLRVTVRVDARGIHWRLLPGIPRATIPHSEVTGVSVVQIRPGDWGGWGWRIGPLGQALLVRTGEGLRIDRGRRSFHISVDDAARGAALIEAYRTDGTA